MSTLGVVVLNLHGMTGLDRCLESIQWADAIWIVNLGEDNPCCGRLRVSPVVRKVETVVEISSLFYEVNTDWVLYLWGEERVGEKLGASLKALVESNAAESSYSYRIPIRSQLFHRWVEGSLWGPVPALRLRRRAATFGLNWWEPVEKWSGEPEGVLTGWIEDYSTSELSQAINRVRSISSMWMEDLNSRGIRIRALRTAWVAATVFFRLLVQQGNLRKGLAALALAVLGAYATLLAFAKLWESGQVTKETPHAG